MAYENRRRSETGFNPVWLKQLENSTTLLALPDGPHLIRISN